MRSFAIIAIATASIAATSADARSVNVIANPGFETGVLAPWVQGRDASNPFFPIELWNVTAIGAHTGSFAATALNNLEIRQNFAPVAVSAIRELSFWLRHPNEAEAPAAVGLFYDDGSEGIAVAITDTTDWQFFDITGDLETGKQLIGFSLFGYDPGEVPRTLLDDVTLLASVATPATLSLFGVGAALMLLRVRRRS